MDYERVQLAEVAAIHPFLNQISRVADWFIMSTTEAASQVFEEIAQLFASAPTDEQILSFRPSSNVALRASHLLTLNRQGHVANELRHELDQYEQAELLMRLVKAQIRARRESSSANE